MSVEENIAMVRRSYEQGLNRGDLNTVTEDFAPDYLHHFPLSPEPLTLSAFEEMFNSFLSAFPGMTVTIADIFGVGDRVAARHIFRGTHQGELMGIPPTGKEVTFTGNDIYRFANGKIAEEWSMFDALGLMQQIGAVPPPPGS
jgi:steroid delta-isomerase-like uncharacterized protein